MLYVWSVRQKMYKTKKELYRKIQYYLVTSKLTYKIIIVIMPYYV